MARRNKEVRDTLTEQLVKTCQSVALEVSLRSLSEERLQSLSAFSADEARLNIKAGGFGGGGADMKLRFSMCWCLLPTQTYTNAKSAKVIASARKKSEATMVQQACYRSGKGDFHATRFLCNRRRLASANSISQAPEQPDRRQTRYGLWSSHGMATLQAAIGPTIRACILFKRASRRSDSSK